MKKEIKIGLTLVAGIVTFYLFIAWGKSASIFSTNQTEYEVIFSNVNGLRLGDPVNIYGLPSGKVNDIKLGEQGPLVFIGVDEEVNIYSDASAEILIKEVLSGKMIELTPGKNGILLNEGGQIQGKISLDFSTAFSSFGTMMESLDPEKMEQLFANLNEVAAAFADLSKELNEGEMKGIFTDLSSSASDLSSLLKKAEEKDLIGKLDQTFIKLEKLSSEAEITMKNFNALAVQMNESTLPKTEATFLQIEKLMSSSEKIIEEVGSMLEQMKDTNSVMGKLLYDEAFLKQIDHTIENLNITLDHVRNKQIEAHVSFGKITKSEKEEKKAAKEQAKKEKKRK